MLRKLILTIGVMIAVGTSFCLAHTTRSKNLTRSELWSATGGASNSLRCCYVLPTCDDAAEHCDDWHSYGKCDNEGREVLVFSGNKKGCIQPNNNVPTCTWETTTHICQTVYPECVWDAANNVCIIDSAYPQNDKDAWDSCTPNCL